jgi:hypothetical protein
MESVVIDWLPRPITELSSRDHTHIEVVGK